MTAPPGPPPSSYYYPYPSPPPARPARAGFAIAALVCGIFAPFALMAHASMGLLLGVAAVVCGIVGIRAVSGGVASGRGMAIWGLVLGIFFSLASIGSLAPTTPATSSANSAASAPPARATAPTPTAVAVTPTTIPGDGAFLVGEEITPGTYRSAGAKRGLFEFCSWSRLRDTSGGSGSTIALGSANADEPMIVTIAATDGAFKSSNCENWTRIK